MSSISHVPSSTHTLQEFLGKFDAFVGKQATGALPHPLLSEAHDTFLSDYFVKYGEYFRNVDVKAFREASACIGLPGVDVRENLGGLGFTPRQTLELFIRGGRYSLNVRDLIGAAHVRVLQSSMVAGGEVKATFKQVLEETARGVAYGAVCITEPSAGSDMHAMRSFSYEIPEATPSLCGLRDGSSGREGARGDESASTDGVARSPNSGGKMWRLCINKMFNGRLEAADYFIVFAQHYTATPSSSQGGLASDAELSPTGGLNAFLLKRAELFPANASEGSSQRPHSVEANGLTSNSFGGFTANVTIPYDRIIGAPGQAMRLFQEHFAYWRLMQVAACIGCAEGALLLAADFIRHRKAFGGGGGNGDSSCIARFTHLQTELGSHISRLEMAKSLARGVADDFPEAIVTQDVRPLNARVSMLKGEAVAFAIAAAEWAMGALGARGYSIGHSDLALRVRDLAGLRIADGTVDLMRLLVVRYTLGDDLWRTATDGHHGCSKDRTAAKAMPGPRTLAQLQARLFQTCSEEEEGDLAAAFSEVKTTVAALRRLLLIHPSILLNAYDFGDCMTETAGGPCFIVTVINMVQMGQHYFFRSPKSDKAQLASLSGLPLLYTLLPLDNNTCGVVGLPVNLTTLRNGRLTNTQIFDLIQYCCEASSLKLVNCLFSVDTRRYSKYVSDFSLTESQTPFILPVSADSTVGLWKHIAASAAVKRPSNTTTITFCLLISDISEGGGGSFVGRHCQILLSASTSNARPSHVNPDEIEVEVFDANTPQKNQSFVLSLNAEKDFISMVRSRNDGYSRVVTAFFEVTVGADSVLTV